MSLAGKGKLLVTPANTRELYMNLPSLWVKTNNSVNEIGDKPGIANTLIYLARLFELNKKYFSAVKLLYAAEHTVKSMGIVFDINAEKEKNGLTARLTELLSDEEFAMYRQEGEKMTIEEACRLAMEC